MAQKYVTISAKIPSSLRNRMKRLGIHPSAIIKRALEDELKMEQAAGIARSVGSIQKILKKIPMQEVVRDVRDDRDSR